MSTIAERLPLVMATIRHRVAETIFDAVDDDGAFAEARDWRQQIEALERQCAELSALMPHNADRYAWQLGDEIRAIEQRVAGRLNEFPWNFIHEHFHECGRRAK